MAQSGTDRKFFTRCAGQKGKESKETAMPRLVEHASTGQTPSLDHHAGIVMGAIWMVVLSLALFFIPGVNGLIAGLVGGYLVGSLGRAMVAAVLPALIVAAGLWVLLAAVGMPILGLFAGAAITVLIVLAELGLFLGAALGAIVHHIMHHA
ncbi:MAG TPA: hypothetical protein VJV04_05350 [Nitrospiraceae bacterium]|nr:hypothetical protein [Nitrospiraceae bacterium]